ncbi:MAG: hypothetical protein ACXWJC_01335 [Croceibacterium sp.]
MKEWSIKEAKRITRIAQFMPEAMREEYIAHHMAEAICLRIALKNP